MSWDSDAGAQETRDVARVTETGTGDTCHGGLPPCSTFQAVSLKWPLAELHLAERHILFE